MKQAKLTRRQNDTLEFIKAFIEEHEYSPTLRDICKGLGVTTPSTTFIHLRHLAKKGYITFENNKARSIKLVDDSGVVASKCAKELIKKLKETPYIMRDDVDIILYSQKSNKNNGTTYNISIAIHNEPHFEEVDDGIRC